MAVDFCHLWFHLQHSGTGINIRQIFLSQTEYTAMCYTSLCAHPQSWTRPVLWSIWDVLRTFAEKECTVVLWDMNTEFVMIMSTGQCILLSSDMAKWLTLNSAAVISCYSQTLCSLWTVFTRCPGPVLSTLWLQNDFVLVKLVHKDKLSHASRTYHSADCDTDTVLSSPILNSILGPSIRERLNLSRQIGQPHPIFWQDLCQGRKLPWTFRTLRILEPFESSHPRMCLENFWKNNKENNPVWLNATLPEMELTLAAK